MAFRFRRSRSIAPGVRLNVTKSGLGLSFGTRGLRGSIHSSGRSTSSAGIPGTGLYYRKDSRTGGRTRTPGTRPTAPPRPVPRRPGLFAPRGEKLLYRAIQRDDLAALEEVARDHPDHRLVAVTLAGLRHDASGNRQRARALLDEVARGGVDPAGEAFWQHYVHASLDVTLPPGIDVTLPVDGAAVALKAAQLHATAGEPEAALEVLRAWPATLPNRLAAAALYRRLGDLNAVVSLTDGVTNDDDLSAMLLVHRGAAFRDQGHHTAARESLGQVVRFRSRAQAVRHAALYERALTNAADGKRAQARKDAERILAEDSTQQRVRDLLARLAGG